MTDEIDDMGFDDVLSGNVYKAPDDPPLTVAVSERLHPAMSPNADTTPSPSAPEVLPSEGLTPAGVQAAKALVALPSTLDSVTMAKLARDIAMDIKERHVILREHGLTNEQYDFLEANNPFFKNALQACIIEWHSPLSTAERVRLASAAILEDSLPGLGARMQNKVEGLPGVVETAKLFQKLSGIGERDAGAANAGERFTINIDLGGDQKIVVTTAQEAVLDTGRDQTLQILANSEGQSGRLAIQEEPEVSNEECALPPLSKGS